MEQEAVGGEGRGGLLLLLLAVEDRVKGKLGAGTGELKQEAAGGEGRIAAATAAALRTGCQGEGGGVLSPEKREDAAAAA